MHHGGSLEALALESRQSAVEAVDLRREVWKPWLWNQGKAWLAR